MTDSPEIIENVAAGLGIHAGDRPPLLLTIKLRLRDKHARELNRQARAVVTRREAKSTGSTTYFTGKPCKHGHVADRRTDNSTCVLCGNVAKARSRQDNPERKRADNLKWKSANKERMSQYYFLRKIEDPLTYKEYRKRTYLNNKTSSIVSAVARKKHVKLATPKWVDIEAIREIYKKAAHLSVETGILYDVDHIVPLRSPNVCGLHVPWNLRALPAAINRGKDNNPRWQCDKYRVGLNALLEGAQL